MKPNPDSELCLLLLYIRENEFEIVMKKLDSLKAAITELGLPELNGVYDDRKSDVCWGKFLGN
jgi:hypothetical protein